MHCSVSIRSPEAQGGLVELQVSSALLLQLLRVPRVLRHGRPDPLHLLPARLSHQVHTAWITLQLHVSPLSQVHLPCLNREPSPLTLLTHIYDDDHDQPSKRCVAVL